MTEYREIVIKIPEEIISFVNLNGFLPENYRSEIGRVLLEGVELPKKHGRLIDEKKITKCEQTGLVIKGDNVICCLKTDAPTIIEADKGE